MISTKFLTVDGSFVAVGVEVLDDAIMSLNKSASPSSFSQFSSNGSALVILPFGDSVTAATIPNLKAATLITMANVSLIILTEMLSSYLLVSELSSAVSMAIVV